MKSKNTKKNSATKFGCDFCGRSFQKETTIDKHLCENKRRWGDKDLKGNRIGFQAWLNFYVHNTTSKKQKTYLVLLVYKNTIYEKYSYCNSHIQ